MTDPFGLVIAALAGAVIGALFFAALWLSLHVAAVRAYGAFWLPICALLRIAVTLAGFYWVAAGDWQRLLACVAGFMLARVVATRLARPSRRPA
ncbi:ATP synthase subunit I [Salinisphaera sp. SPP-AMP-43]|uniref:N-ATPase subunit AtpR n=1 Tax=Salinisphaera sp. SPP-AMP-43 TaxID=3121288 RepID=UPI003C6DBAEC